MNAPDKNAGDLLAWCKKESGLTGSVIGVREFSGTYEGDKYNPITDLTSSDSGDIRIKYDSSLDDYNIIIPISIESLKDFNKERGNIGQTPSPQCDLPEDDIVFKAGNCWFSGSIDLADGTGSGKYICNDPDQGAPDGNPPVWQGLPSCHYQYSDGFFSVYSSGFWQVEETIESFINEDFLGNF